MNSKSYEEKYGVEKSNILKENLKKQKPPMKGKHHTEKTKQIISISKTGYKHTEETKIKMSKSKSGIRLSENHKKQISERQLGKKQSKVFCNICGKEGGERAMKRYHFENCKLSPHEDF